MSATDGERPVATKLETPVETTAVSIVKSLIDAGQKAEINKIITRIICKDVAQCISEYAAPTEFSFWQVFMNRYFGVPDAWKQGLQKYIGTRIVKCTGDQLVTITFENPDKTTFAHNFKLSVEPSGINNIGDDGDVQPISAEQGHHLNKWCPGFHVRGIAVSSNVHRAFLMKYGLHGGSYPDDVVGDIINFGLVISRTIDGPIYPRQLWINCDYNHQYNGQMSSTRI